MLKGLLIKDICVISKQMRIFLLVIAVMAVIPNNFSQGFALMYSSMLPITAIAYDEQSKWDQYAQMMPYSVRDLVLSKYLLGMLGPIIVGILEMTSIGVIMGIKGDVDLLAEKELTILLVFCAALILAAINLPLVFKLGVEKGRFAYLLLTIGVAVTIVYGIDNQGALWSLEPMLYLVGLGVLSAVCLPCSICVSIKAYRHKNC